MGCERCRWYLHTGVPAAEQVLEKADWAGAAALEGQILAMTDWTLVAFWELQMAPKSAGLGSVLTAARRQAGGVARTGVAASARLISKIMVFMVTVLSGLLMLRECCSNDAGATK